MSSWLRLVCGISLSVLAVALIFLVSYLTIRDTPKLDEPETITELYDEHGCLVSAGFSWCSTRGVCLQEAVTPCEVTGPRSTLSVPPDLLNTEWVWERSSAGDESIIPMNPGTYRLSLAESGLVTLATPCGNLSALFE